MAIQISGTTVIDNSRNITNFESVAGNGVATQAEAEAGTNNDQVMTPLRVAQSVAANASSGGVDDDINWSGCNVGCAVRGGGNVFYKTGGIIWIVAPSTAQVYSTWPMGFCNGTSGTTPNQAQRVTGRDGWFIADKSMMQTAVSCRTYWDTHNEYVCYWTSAEYNDGIGWAVSSPFAGLNGVYKGCCHCVRPMRVICYT
jgi:hypothetical protein